MNFKVELLSLRLFCIVAAIFVLLFQAVRDQQHRELSASAARLETMAKSGAVDERGQDLDEQQFKQLDLSAQERMADAAERVVLLTIVQTVIGILGTAAVAGALFWTIKGTESATLQAQAAIDGNALARAAHAAEMRPWVTVEVAVAGPLFYNINGLNLSLNFHTKNIGRAPAIGVWPHPELATAAIGIENFDVRHRLNEAATTGS